MKQLFIYILFTCACFRLQAQVNFVKNPGLEQYSKCPEDPDQISFAKSWSSIIDTLGTGPTAMEYLNACDGSGKMYCSVPSSGSYYQYPHSGHGMAGGHFFFDGKPPALSSPFPSDYRDYLHGRLYRKLDAGLSYCIKFFVNLAEFSAYCHNKMGAYLDDGTIDAIGLPPGSVITSVIPQVFTNVVINDTANWIMVEGSFIALGTENFISIGNFFKKADMTYLPMPFGWGDRVSYYLIDDISVIPVDLSADAGPDNFVAETKTVQIGRVGDTTTDGLDCKWYHKGALIDSGATITVHAGAKGDIDTYVVVQTICGNVKTDTTVIYTVGLGMKETAIQNKWIIAPNPSVGIITLSGVEETTTLTATLYDLLGRVQYRQHVPANNTLQLQVPAGLYILELADDKGAKQRQHLEIR